MLNTTLKPLRFTIAGFSLFAAMASAQAVLTLSFQQDENTGHLNIVFNGQATAALTATIPAGSFGAITSNSIIVQSTGDYWFPGSSGWDLQGYRPWTGELRDPVSIRGTGGFLYSIDSSYLQIWSTTNTPNQIVWDGEMAFEADLVDIGLSDGQSGTFAIVKGGDTITINWDAIVIPAVPEPATYALILGAGIAGVALLRRRSRS